MGTIAHHAIIVTGVYGDWTQKAHAFAERIFPEAQVSPIATSPTNGYKSFCIFPDGSKEGWEESQSGDEQRDAFIAWLERQRYGDLSAPLSWVEINYGEIAYAGNGAKITRSTWDGPLANESEAKP